MVTTKHAETGEYMTIDYVWLTILCRVGPILREMGSVEAMEWLIRETQPIG